ncbi:hypothetical protein EJ04DRAFT_556360, partial [Polyplosphaeria fusca]
PISIHITPNTQTPSQNAISRPLTPQKTHPLLAPPTLQAQKTNRRTRPPPRAQSQNPRNGAAQSGAARRDGEKWDWAEGGRELEGSECDGGGWASYGCEWVGEFVGV